MCRLLAYASPVATTLEALIGASQCTAFGNMSRLHADGWGTAWIAPGLQQTEVQRTRATIPVDPAVPLSRTINSQAASARIVHLRMATSGMAVEIENTHPFLADNLAFGHNGSVVPIAKLRPLLSAEMLASVRGGTDSELYFALIRQHRLGGMALADAVVATVTLLRARFPNASLNALVLGEDELVVVHSSENATAPLEEFRARGLEDAELPLDHVSNYYGLSYLQTTDGSIAFSSSGIDTTGWTPLPPASVASVSLATMELTIRSLVEGPVGPTG